MKKDIHPADYREVVFQDTSNGVNFLTRSTTITSEKIMLDGKEYPLIKVHISSASHPFFTGEEKIVDIEGRVDRFKAQQAAAMKKREAMTKKSAKKKSTPEKKTKETITEKVGSKAKEEPKKDDQ